MAVAMGPLSATRFLRTESTAAWLTTCPWSEDSPARPAISSQSICTPAASRTRRVAEATSGPMPSPGINVTLCFMDASYCKRSLPGGRIAAEAGVSYQEPVHYAVEQNYCYTVRVDSCAGVPASGGQENL